MSSGSLSKPQTLSELHHPGIVTHIAHGIAEQGSPYLAMEWLDGFDLSVRIRQRSCLPMSCLCCCIA